MKKFLVFSVLLIVSVGFLSIVGKMKYPNPINPTSVKPQSKAVEVIASNLSVPWALDFLPGNEIIFTQRGGTVSTLHDKKINELTNIKDVKSTGEGGLLGIAVHPKFSSNRYIYLYYTYDSTGQNTKNKVVRYILKDDQLIQDKVIVGDIPGALFHNGGRIKFGPDGYLYVTTGDSQAPSLAQDKNSIAGKILRVTDDGDEAPDNPFGTLIYSMGHRNPQGLAWDGNRLFETEHGNSTHDEVNVIARGGNFGWPSIQGDEKESGSISPLTQSGNETWAPSGASIFNGSLFFGGLRGEALFELRISSSTAILNKHFLNEFGRIRDVVLGPDNFLYITTSNQDGRGAPTQDDDRIIKVDPSKL